LWGFGVRAGRLLCLLALCLVLPARADPPQGGYPFVAYDEGLERAQRDSKRIFLYFGRLGCAWCERVNKEAFTEAEVRRRYIEHYVLVYLDTEGGRRLTLPSGERITEMDLAARYRVMATPVFAYLEPDGRLIVRVVGVQSARDFLLYDEFVHGEAYRRQDLRQFLAENPTP
jgi:thioredoxin-related protein